MKRIDREGIVSESIGKRFGHLVVLSLSYYKDYKDKKRLPMVLCKCDCGNDKIVSLWDLRQGKTKTCGFNHPHIEDRTIPAFNRIYRYSYRDRAIKNGIEFSISEEDFRRICELPCHYCGMRPEEFNATTGWANVLARGKTKSGKYLSEWKYNGLDRVDPNGGYTLENVVPCCGTCNHAKHTMSYDDFMNWVNRIVAYQSGNGDK